MTDLFCTVVDKSPVQHGEYRRLASGPEASFCFRLHPTQRGSSPQFFSRGAHYRARSCPLMEFPASATGNCHGCCSPPPASCESFSSEGLGKLVYGCCSMCAATFLGRQLAAEVPELSTWSCGVAWIALARTGLLPNLGFLVVIVSIVDKCSMPTFRSIVSVVV